MTFTHGARRNIVRLEQFFSEHCVNICLLKETHQDLH